MIFDTDLTARHFPNNEISDGVIPRCTCRPHCICVSACLALCSVSVPKVLGGVGRTGPHFCRYGNTCNVCTVVVQGNDKSMLSHRLCNLKSSALSGGRGLHTFPSELPREEFCHILKSSLLIFLPREALGKHENLPLQAGSFCV